MKWEPHYGSGFGAKITPDLLVIYQQITLPLKTTVLFWSQFCGSGVLGRAQPGGSLWESQSDINRGCSHLRDVQNGTPTRLPVVAGHCLGPQLGCKPGHLPVTPQHGHDFFLTCPRMGAPRKPGGSCMAFSDLALEVSRHRFCCIQSSHEPTQISRSGSIAPTS